MAILFKILGIERAWHALRETIPRPRQVFVTKSRVLATKVQESFDRHYASFIDDLPGTPERRTRLYGQGQSYRPMISAEEQAEWDSDLPRRFSELEDRHFPLFITFNQVCCDEMRPVLNSLTYPMSAMQSVRGRLRGFFC